MFLLSNPRKLWRITFPKGEALIRAIWNGDFPKQGPNPGLKKSEDQTNVVIYKEESIHL